MVKVSVIYATWCPSCPATKSFWKKLKNEIPFEYEEIDIDSDQGRELALRHKIKSVPTTLVNGRSYFVGIPEKSRALQVLKSSP
ncbi:MAG: glutaredoxin family protein [Leptospirales bacterium]